MKKIFNQNLKLLLISIQFVVFGCAIQTKQDNKLKVMVIDDTGLLFSPSFDLQPKLQLSPDEINYDISVLIYALTHAYGGRNYVPKDSFERAIQNLEQLKKQNIGSLELCKLIGEKLELIQDNHLLARIIPGSHCAPTGHFREGKVGKNFGYKDKSPWTVNYIKILKKKIPLISITKFPHSKDPVWNGFLDKLSKIKKNSNAIIIDLRGNEGGDDAMGLAMANYFYGNKDHPNNLLERIVSQTPATLAMKVTGDDIKIAKFKSKGTSVPEFLLEHQKMALAEYNNAKHSPIPSEQIFTERQDKPFDATKAFTNPIYILVDAECASSCESTLGEFEGHPFVITVGENTGGFVHFGNLGRIVLPHSQIQVQMGTDFWKFRDGRYIEKIGYSPKLKVIPGKDALDVVKRELQSRFRSK
jgi:hypothetical protein